MNKVKLKAINTLVFSLLVACSNPLFAQVGVRTIAVFDDADNYNFQTLVGLGDVLVPSLFSGSTFTLRTLDFSLAQSIRIDSAAGGSIWPVPADGFGDPGTAELLVTYSRGNSSRFADLYDIDGDLRWSTSAIPGFTYESHQWLSKPLFDSTYLLLSGRRGGERYVVGVNCELLVPRVSLEQADVVAGVRSAFPSKPLILATRNGVDGFGPSLRRVSRNDLFAISPGNYALPLPQDWGLDGEYDYLRAIFVGSDDYSIEIKSESGIRYDDRLIRYRFPLTPRLYSLDLRPADQQFRVARLLYRRADGSDLSLYYNVDRAQRINSRDASELALFSSELCVNEERYFQRSDESENLYSPVDGSLQGSIPLTIPFGMDTTTLFRPYQLDCSIDPAGDVAYSYRFRNPLPEPRSFFLLNDNFELVATFPSFSFSGVYEASTGKAYVKANNIFDSDSVTVFELDRTVDLHTVASEDATFRVFPNPGGDVLNVVLSSFAPENQIRSIALINSSGQVVKAVKEATFSGRINTSRLPFGVYSIVVRYANGNTITRRWIKVE